MTQPAVVARGLIKQFPGNARHVLDDLSFTIARGECVALLGPSGCGKTTLLRLLMGIEQPSAGELVVDPELHARLAYVFQEARLVPWRTTLENVLLPFELAGRVTPEARQRAERLLVRIGLGDRLGHFPRELSGGMQMRAALARALVTEPRILLLDEPFAALDERTRFRLEDLLLEFRRELDLQYVFVTHSIAEAVYLGDRVLLLDTHGRLNADETIRLGARDQDLKLDPAFSAQVRALSTRFHALEESA